MSKSIISIKLNRINSLPSIDSISSISLLINKIQNGGSTVDFKKIIVLHEDYLVSKNNMEKMKIHLDEVVKEETESPRIHSENLKGYLQSLVGETEEIFMVSSFSDINEQMGFMEIVHYLFGPYKLNVFNTLSPLIDNDLSFCQENIQKFLNYLVKR